MTQPALPHQAACDPSAVALGAISVRAGGSFRMQAPGEPLNRHESCLPTHRARAAQATRPVRAVADQCVCPAIDPQARTVLRLLRRRFARLARGRGYEQSWRAGPCHHERQLWRRHLLLPSQTWPRGALADMSQRARRRSLHSLPACCAVERLSHIFCSTGVPAGLC